MSIADQVNTFLLAFEKLDCVRMVIQAPFATTY